MSIVGISETKWFDDVYKVVSFTVLQSGRCVLQSSDTIQRGEGVNIALDLLMATSGGDLSAISSRIVHAHLQLCLSSSNKFNVTTVSVHALPIEHLLR